MYLIPFPMINPVAIDLGIISIHWYGVAYLVGISLAWLYARQIAHVFDLKQKDFDDFITWAVVGIILGGRLGYVLFYDPIHFLEHPLDILKTRQGGMAFHGGLLGVVVATIVYCWKMGVPLMRFGDLLAVVSPIGLFLGRVANFINAEHYGRPTDVAWAMVFPRSDGLPRHPSQLYEAVGEGFVIGLLAWTLMNRFAHKPGRLSGLFMLSYGLIRFCIEFFRDPSDGFVSLGFATLTLGQALCVPMVLVGLYWLNRKLNSVYGQNSRYCPK